MEVHKASKFQSSSGNTTGVVLFISGETSLQHAMVDTSAVANAPIMHNPIQKLHLGIRNTSLPGKKSLVTTRGYQGIATLCSPLQMSMNRNYYSTTNSTAQVPYVTPALLPGAKAQTEGESFTPAIGFLQPLKGGVKNRKYAVIDIETYVDPRTRPLVPYAVGILTASFPKGKQSTRSEVLLAALRGDGGSGKSMVKVFYKDFYITDFHSYREFWQQVFGHIFTKLRNARIFAHNLARFDSAFLTNAFLSHMIDLAPEDGAFPLLGTSGGLISLDLVYKGHKVHFQDSYQMLPQSLNKLGESFNLATKQPFPHSFVSESTLNYVGQRPDNNMYGLTLSKYQEFVNLVGKTFDLRSECLSYLRRDCELLFSVLTLTADKFMGMFNVNPLSVPTISSLAMLIYRSNFQLGPLSDPSQVIPIGACKYNDSIRHAYYGGHVDVYQPLSDKAYYYDINSLYPAAMLQPMPTGIPRRRLTETKSFFGIAKYSITAPVGLEVPFLPYRNPEDGQLTFPLGQWMGWYFSEEIRHARAQGYTCEFLHGYEYTRTEGLFSNYVNTLYDMKSTAKDDVERLIAKLL